MTLILFPACATSFCLWLSFGPVPLSSPGVCRGLYYLMCSQSQLLWAECISPRGQWPRTLTLSSVSEGDLCLESLCLEGTSWELGPSPHLHFTEAHRCGSPCLKSPRVQGRAGDPRSAPGPSQPPALLGLSCMYACVGHMCECGCYASGNACSPGCLHSSPHLCTESASVCLRLCGHCVPGQPVWVWHGELTVVVVQT